MNGRNVGWIVLFGFMGPALLAMATFVILAHQAGSLTDDPVMFAFSVAFLVGVGVWSLVTTGLLVASNLAYEIRGGLEPDELPSKKD